MQHGGYYHQHAEFNIIETGRLVRPSLQPTRQGTWIVDSGTGFPPFWREEKLSWNADSRPNLLPIAIILARIVPRCMNSVNS